MTSAGGLVGRRVVVTRAAGNADVLAELVTAAGGEAVVVPLIEVVDTGAVVPDLAGFDWLVVTSPNGAGHAPAPLPPGVRVAAVGSATASTLAERGIAADLVPSRQSGAGLVAEFPAGTGAVLVIQAVDGADTIARGLQVLGWRVTAVATHRAVPVDPTEAQRAAAAEADVLLVASGSAARAWVAAFGTWAPPVVVAIGPQTAADAERVGFTVHRVAADHSLPGLVAAAAD